ncbi:hypothetical protein HIM_12269 [Hirsutella minnesotensis 3608]|uniref:Uncharacterized protein n=1 Tax=Hirsutella minnesotensis 3608 TaxID=1043627 RepID=A0A0F7ZF13_9HYPO|nr:hypothetical protein HIM_12269 [Hirsutella minnesotensis 3608]
MCVVQYIDVSTWTFCGEPIKIQPLAKRWMMHSHQRYKTKRVRTCGTLTRYFAQGGRNVDEENTGKHWCDGQATQTRPGSQLSGYRERLQ